MKILMKSNSQNAGSGTGATTTLISILLLLSMLVLESNSIDYRCGGTREENIAYKTVKHIIKSN